MEKIIEFSRAISILQNAVTNADVTTNLKIN
jgi:hypothetical protein